MTEIDLEQLRNYVDERTENIKDRQDFTFNFGMYKDHRILEVFVADPQYLKYIYEKARFKLSPRIREFIIDNSQQIKLAIKEQEKKELSVF